jgi:hypothetical protein
VGGSMVVRITYPQPSVWLDLWGGMSGTFAGLDRFNRIIDQCCQNSITGTPADIDRYQYGYDQNSNRLWKGNVVAHAAGVYLDEAYTYDNINRLAEMQRGNLSSGSITGTPVREMDYTLDPTGNWSRYLTKTSGTTDLNQGRASNTVNEITNINASTGSIWVTPLYDAAGNMTTMPQPARQPARRCPLLPASTTDWEDALSNKMPRAPGTITTPTTGRILRNARAR